MAESTGRKLLTDEELEARRVFVMNGRKKAWSFYRIAEEVERTFGYPISAAQCSQDYKVIMRRRSLEMNEELDAQRHQTLDQIDMILEKHLELAILGDVDAAEVCLKALTRKARITGMDAPLKSERKDTTARPRLTEAQIMDKMRGLMQKLGVKGAISGPNNVIDVTPAMLSQKNVAVLTGEGRDLDDEQHGREENDEEHQ